MKTARIEWKLFRGQWDLYHRRDVGCWSFLTLSSLLKVFILSPQHESSSPKHDSTRNWCIYASVPGRGQSLVSINLFGMQESKQQLLLLIVMVIMLLLRFFVMLIFFGDCVLNSSANLMSLLRLGWKVTKPLQVVFCQPATYQQWP